MKKFWLILTLCLLLVPCSLVKAEEITLDQIVEKLKESYTNDDSEGNQKSTTEITHDDKSITIKTTSTDMEEEYVRVVNYQDGVLSFKADEVDEDLELSYGIADNVLAISLIDSILELKQDENTISNYVADTFNFLIVINMPWQYLNYEQNGIETKTKKVNYTEQSSGSESSDFNDFDFDLNVDVDIQMELYFIEEIKINIDKLNIKSFIDELKEIPDEESTESSGTDSNIDQVENTETMDDNLPDNPSTGISLPIISLIVLIISLIVISLFTKKKSNLFKL